MRKRDTSQRRAIRQVFLENTAPLSTQEVLNAAQAHKPGLGIATVYRNLKILLDEGWLTTVRTAGMPPRYERADRPSHHYFYCNHCGKVVEVPCRPEYLDRMIPPGYNLERHEMVLYGRCSTCAAAAPPAPNENRFPDHA